MKRILLISTLLAGLASASVAAAETNTASQPFTVTGNVPTLCSGGTVTGGNTVFALGTIVDTATGLLLNDLSAPSKVIAGAFCNSASTINVTATPMVASSFTGTPPAGFADAVDFTATASGWTTTPASFTTDATSNPNATQTQTTAFSGSITVAVSNFSAVGSPTDRMIADPDYAGTVTVTLAAQAAGGSD